MTLTARERYQRQMREQDLMDAIIEAALRLGYRCLHVPDKLYGLAAKEGRFDAMDGAKGFPDLLLLRERDGRRYVIETKTAKGTVKDEQTAWLSAFAACGVPAMVIRPNDLDSVLAMLQ